MQCVELSTLRAVWWVSDNSQRSCRAGFDFVSPRDFTTKSGHIKAGKAKGLPAPSVPAAD